MKLKNLIAGICGLLAAWIACLGTVELFRIGGLSPTGSSTGSLVERELGAQESPRGKSVRIPATRAPLTSEKAAPSQPSRPVNPVRQASDDQPARQAGSQPAGQANDAPTAQLRLPLFQEWKNPDVALVFTGRQAGYIEPCGCTGLANQKGGLSRRDTLLNDLRKRGWTLVPMDVGNQVKRTGRQSEIKFQMTYEGLKMMDYQAIGLGPDDLRMSPGEVFAAISDQPPRFVSANVAVLDRDLLARSASIEANGKKIGVTAVVADEYREALRGDEVIFTGAVDGIRTAWAQLQRERCDLNVLLVYGSLEESRRLALQFPQFQVVVTTGGGEEPPIEPEPIPNSNSRTVVVPVGGKGMYVGVLGYYPKENPPFRYQRVPLDDRFQDSTKMLELLGAYQDQLRNAGLEGLGVKPQPHPSGRSFVGSETCGECHTKAWEVFQNTPHAHAFDTLVNPKERAEIARHYDPECLSCHVTGWDPQRYLPFKSGFLGLQATPAMVHNGCENCHGPGSAHVAAENGEGNPTSAQVDSLRASMRLPLAKARDKCVECHDQDNSPAFQKDGAFEKYWKKVEHKGKD